LAKPIPVSMLLNPIHLLSLGFGSGLSPYAPGTMGTLVAIPLYLLLSQLELLTYSIVVVAGFLIGIYLCDKTSKALGVHDHSGIVWDEFIGYWITMIAIPAVTWQWILAGFVLFRFFDIAKPWPVKVADKRVPGGFGIMLDDLLAGLYALACIQAFWFLMASKL
jgi:phosphatidylglycerophosphatase A